MGSATLAILAASTMTRLTAFYHLIVNGTRATMSASSNLLLASPPGRKYGFGRVPVPAPL